MFTPADMINVQGCNVSIQNFILQNSDPDDPYTKEVWSRFVGKFEAPSISRVSLLHAKAFEEWIDHDSQLSVVKTNGLYPSDLYKVRGIIHEWMRMYRPVKDVVFTPGEHSIPSRGAVSLEAKLSRPWAVTPSCFEKFAEMVYNHKALKRAARHKFDQQTKEIGKSMGRAGRGGKAAFFEMLANVVQFTQGSRFSTVPKNNEKRRPINIEPFGNILCQRQIGLGLRELSRKLGNDLQVGQDIHRRRIREEGITTIDLKNASDSVSLDLVAFLFPKWFVDILDETRSFGVYFEDAFYVTRKISAMGNGFTFELMTMILLAITRLYDEKSTVYGDDIICSDESYHKIRLLLEQCGFIVNTKKTMHRLGRRESCGAYYIDDVGYVTAYDMRWAENPLDAVMLVNKVYRLSIDQNSTLREEFRELHRRMLGCFSKKIRGFDIGEELPPYVIDPSLTKSALHPNSSEIKLFRQLQREVCWPVYCLEAVNVERSKTRVHLSARQWAKYEMYLHAGRRSTDHLASTRIVARRCVLGLGLLIS